MSVSFTVLQINKFPKCPRDKGAVILECGERTLIGSTPATRFTLQDASIGGKYEYYRVYHEAVRKQLGRTYEGHEFTSFFARNEFNAYLDRSSNRLICSTSKRVAHSLADTLNKEKPRSFNADFLSLDLGTIRPRVKEINGVWVSEMSQPFLRCIGLYGPNVDRSDMCKLAESLGVANSLLISYDFKNSPNPVMMSADYCVAFPGEVVEAYCLDVLQDLQQKIFVSAEGTTLARFNRPKSRKDSAPAQGEK